MVLTYAELVEQTQQLCRQIADDPEQRLAVRERFYQRYGHVIFGGNGYGNSELAFMRWEIDRKVLNPLTDNVHPGSPWWRNVNLQFIYFSELAGKMKEYGVNDKSAPTPVHMWLNYIEQPSEVSWYRAHNSSILMSSQMHYQDLLRENEYEQDFINRALYRLMYAQAMVEEATIFGDLGKISANPRGMAVKLITSLNGFYPKQYPLTAADEECIEGKGVGLEEWEVKEMDEYLILPRIRQLYINAAHWNQLTFCALYGEHNKPSYANPAFTQTEPAAIESYAAVLPMLRKPTLYQVLWTSFKIWLRKVFIKPKKPAVSSQS
ncbi:MAG: hypothetical protein CMF25_00055 [Kangiellaceae bacterium]|nr:hypothetical protein [Kangiellaceae bacterium]|tara:strand:- start:2225 stop:3187 length:963 start_codon:yes stop_codon:yes gene_type:complete